MFSSMAVMFWFIFSQAMTNFACVLIYFTFLGAFIHAHTLWMVRCNTWLSRRIIWKRILWEIFHWKRFCLFMLIYLAQIWEICSPENVCCKHYDKQAGEPVSKEKAEFLVCHKFITIGHSISQSHRPVEGVLNQNCLL